MSSIFSTSLLFFFWNVRCVDAKKTQNSNEFSIDFSKIFFQFQPQTDLIENGLFSDKKKIFHAIYELTI